MAIETSAGDPGLLDDPLDRAPAASQTRRPLQLRRVDHPRIGTTVTCRQSNQSRRSQSSGDQTVRRSGPANAIRRRREPRHEHHPSPEEVRSQRRPSELERSAYTCFITTVRPVRSCPSVVAQRGRSRDDRASNADLEVEDSRSDQGMVSEQRRGRTFETQNLELLPSFGSFVAVRLLGELRGHDASLGRSSFAAYVLASTGEMLAAHGRHMTGPRRVGAQTGLSVGGGSGREGKGSSCNHEDRIAARL